MTKRIYLKAHAAVRFYGELLDPLVVSKMLRLPYDHIHRAGEPSLGRTKKGEVREYAPYRVGMWSMSSERWIKSANLKTHIVWLLEQLEPHADAIRALLATGIIADIFCYSCGNSMTPPPLPRAVSERAKAMGMNIVIDHYEGSSRSA